MTHKQQSQPGSLILEPGEQQDNLRPSERPAEKEEKMLPLHLETSDKNIVYQLYLNKLIQAYLFGAYWQAFEHAVKVEQYLDGLASPSGVVPFYFYDSLTRLALFPHVPISEQEGLLTRIKSNREKIQHWARQDPAAYLYQLYLVTAEQARVSGRKAEAGKYYDKAIISLRQSAPSKEKALIYELAGRFYLAEGETDSALGYLREASRIYQHWGASSKAKELEKQYPELLSVVIKDRLPVEMRASRFEAEEARSLDLTEVIRATQAISAEIRLDSLLAQLIKFVLENSGAQQAFLVLERSGVWYIEAEGRAGQEQVSVLQARPVGFQPSSAVLPLSIINAVALTQEHMVLDDAAKNEQFGHDAYLKRHQPQSILCTPLISRGKLMGVLYLEHKVEAGIFSAERRHILNLLAGQAATSIENAYLYADLEASERTYRTLFEDSKDPIFVATLLDQILDVNPAGSKFSGYTKIELLRKRMSDFYADPEQWQAFKQALEERGALRDFQLQFRRKDGSVRECLLTATVWRASDDKTISGYQAILRDVTESNQMDRLKSSFISVITHELRSPFVAADLSIQLLQRYLEKGMVEALQEQIQQLDRELIEGRRMIDSVISFASLVSKQGDLFLEETNITTLIREVTIPLEKMAAARHISLTFHLPLKLPRIRLDQQRIGEAIYQLVHNAIKFNQDGGSVLISCQSIGTHLIFKVDDTGRGIPAEKLEKVWDAFIQMADGVKRGVEGLGLGLALVKFAVEAHGGQVMATSKLGIGSTFGFQLSLEVDLPGSST